MLLVLQTSFFLPIFSGRVWLFCFFCLGFQLSSVVLLNYMVKQYLCVPQYKKLVIWLNMVSALSVGKFLINISNVILSPIVINTIKNNKR